MRTSAFTLTAACLASLLVGCSSSNGDPDAGPPVGVTLSPVEMCTRMADARCGLLQRCWPSFAHDTPETCASREQSRCLDSYTLLKPTFEKGTVEIDVDKVLSCEERMKSSACTPSFPPGYFSIATSPFSDCEITTGLLRGKVESNQDCTESVECSAGTVCYKSGGTCAGACTTYPTENEPCAFGCAPGLFCNGKGTSDSTDDVCAKPQGLNAPCTSSLECDGELWCDKVCKKRGSSGEPCAFDPLRLSTCAPGLACDVLPFVDAKGTCIEPLPQGEFCRFHWSCQAGLVCLDLDLSHFPDSEGNPGTCAPAAGIDNDCAFNTWTAYMGEQCAAGLTCDSTNHCRARPELGDACSSLTQSCAGNGVYCKPSRVNPANGTCTRSAGINEPCAARIDSTRTVSIPCESGWCDTDQSLTCLPPSKPIDAECHADGECLSGRCAVMQDQSLRCAQACD